MDVTLDELVQDSEKLLMDVQGHTDLPFITRSLDQMRVLGDKFQLSRGPRTDVKAARLLGNKMSYELPGHLTSKLESSSTTGPLDAAPPRQRLDVQTFLKTERENALLNIIAVTQESLFESIENRTSLALRVWWEQEAAAVLSALSGSSGPIDTDLLHHTLTRDNSNNSDIASAPVGRGSNRTREELTYYKQLDRFFSLQPAHPSSISSQPVTNHHRNLLTFLGEANSATGDSRSVDFYSGTKHSEIQEIWSLFLRFGDAISEFRIPSDDNVDTNQHILERRSLWAFQRTLIECSLMHLESEFMSFMRVAVANNPRVAKLGGRPGTRALVKAYLNICLPACLERSNVPGTPSGSSFVNDTDGAEFEDGLVDSKPVWPMIYYCLRIGDSRTAIEVAQAASGSLENFAGILGEYINDGRRLSTATLTRHRQLGLQVLKLSRDPYKRLIFSILGFGAANDHHPEVATSIDDFLWVKLSQVAAYSGSSVSTKWQPSEESPSLGQLQTLLHDVYGEVHFDAWSQPLVYFKLLCLTQQFEAAIAFLARFESLRAHAVHIALALNNQRLLLLSESLRSPLVSRNESDPVGFRRLNLARLVMLYTRKFEVDNPTEAVMYFYLLSSLSSPKPSDFTDDLNENAVTSGSLASESLFVTCVVELALATNEFDLLFGNVSDTGVRKSGAIDRFCSSPDERQNIIAAAASALESRGQLVDSVAAYQLAADSGHGTKHYLQKAVSITNCLLAGVVSFDVGISSLQSSGPRAVGHRDRDTILRLATKLARRVCQSDPLFQQTHRTEPCSVGIDDKPSGPKTLFYLLDLATFFDLVQSEQWQNALDHIDQLGLFPTSPQLEQVESKVDIFSQLPDYVRRPIPSTLIAVMRCLSALYNRQRTASVDPNTIPLGEQSNLTMIAIQNRARALVAYVGRLPYKLSGDVYSHLAQMQMDLM